MPFAETDRHARSISAAAAVRRGAAHLRPDARHDVFPHLLAAARRDAIQGHRVARTELAAARAAVRLCLQQPVRAAGPFLPADRAVAHHAPCRPCLSGPRLDIRRDARAPGLRARDQQQRAAARRVLRHRRAGAVGDVVGVHRAYSRRPAMTPGARLAAAIEVYEAIERERRPAADALKAWGLTHRFAGSGDRAAIAGLLYDALRRRASSAFLMGDESPRAVALGMLKRERGLDVDAIARLADGSRFAPAPLSDDERRRLETGDLSGAPAHIGGDYPEWLDAQFAQSF